MSWITDCAVWDGIEAPPLVWGDFNWDLSLGITSPIQDVIAGADLTWTGSVITAGSINGLTAADFPGSGTAADHRLLTENLSGSGFNSQPITVVVVAKPDAVSDHTIFDRLNASLAFTLYAFSSGWNINAGTNLSCGSAGTTAKVFWVEFNGASSKLYINNTSVGSGAAGSNSTLGQLIFGINRANGSRFDGQIGEIILASEIADSATRGTITSQLMTKWGIS